MGTVSAETPDVVDINVALVIGELVGVPETRTLPSGTVAASFSLTVRTAGAKTTSVPAVWYDPPRRLEKWGPGERLVVYGSIVRRFFRSAAGLGSATEVVVHHAELERHRAKSRRAISRAQTVLGEISSG